MEDDGQLCALCDNPIDAKLDPCNHAVLCHNCASTIKRCPLCKVHVFAVLKLCVMCKEEDAIVTLQPCKHTYCQECCRRLRVCFECRSTIESKDGLVISDERAQQLIDEALGKGSLKQRDVVSTVTGLTGSGKTCLLSRLFGKDPPDLYTSTGLAEKSERGLFHHIGNVSFQLLSDKDILEFLAPLIQVGMTEGNVVSLASKLLGMEVTTSTQPPSLPSPSSKPQSLPEKSPTSQEMVRLVKTNTSMKEMVLELIHMIDTGGQPEFMERMPCLIHNANLAVLVVNLLYGLDERPPVRFHMKGVAYKREMPSQYSTRQMIRKLAATLQAKRSSHSFFQILVVATHRDCVKGDLKARIDALNLELRDSLLPTYRDKLITFSKHQLAFVLNLKDPDDDDKKALELIRSKVSDKAHVLGKVIDIPGSFFMYEQDLLKYAAEKKRDILSLNECLYVGDRLKMEDEVVQAALVFFHRNNTFLYFREVLPNLVFVRPQVPLDFVNTVVLFSYKISDGCTHGIPADIADSLENGIITEEMLSCDELSTCFVRDLYEPRHAIELSCHTFTLAPLKWSEPSTKSAQPITVADSKKDQYLMMCLLPPIPDEDLHQHIPSSANLVPLVVKFCNDCVPLGCFGSIISCLLSFYNWDIFRNDDDSPKCLAHNIASLVCPTPTDYLNIVLVDTADYLVVHVDIAKYLPQVRNEIFGAIAKVFDIMHITDSEIEVSPAFLCPCKKVGRPHTASLDEVDSKQILDCSKKRWKGEAQDKYTMWFGDKPSQTGAADTVLKEDSVPSKPAEWNFDLSRKRGIAVLVTCDYDNTPRIPTLKDTNDDAFEMKETFEQFDYNIVQLQNREVTEHAVLTLVERLSTYLRNYNGAIVNDGESRDAADSHRPVKAIVFAFSGHGTNDNIILANDGEPIFLRDVVKPLVESVSIGPTSDRIPKLFFIDACRGANIIKVPEAKGNTNVNDIQGNFNIEFATIHDHRAFTDSWMPVLARELRRNDDTYQNVLAKVKGKVHERFKLQQAQTLGQLKMDPFKLYYKRKH